MRLQASLHGLNKAEREQRGDELIERVGLTEAADRKVGGYSGGMKRRLDLALALVHEPRILFLDEPTTGLDIQSRTALWEEVARLAAEDGVTVFLTTQYLEEADVLADRVGIIDHGQHRRRGHPGRAEGRDRPADGRSGARAIPASASSTPRVLARFGEPADARPGRRRGPPRRAATRRWPTWCGRSTREGIAIANLELHAPSLDDVFLAKTGRSLEGAEEAGEEAEDARAEAGRRAA